MRAMLLLIPALLAACDTDCDNPARLNGEYDTFSNVVGEDWSVTGLPSDGSVDITQADLLGAVFANGASEWDLTWQPSSDAYKLDLNGQTQTATVTSDEANCNHMVMTVAGTYLSDIGSVHTFKWVGDLGYYGDHLTGTYTYEDSWTYDTQAGTISFGGGEFRADASGDTGG